MKALCQQIVATFLLSLLATSPCVAGDFTQMVSQNILEDRLLQFLNRFKEKCIYLEKECTEEHNNLCLFLDDISDENGEEISTKALEKFVSDGFNQKKLLPLLQNISIHINESDYEDFLDEFKRPPCEFSSITASASGIALIFLLFPWVIYGALKAKPPSNSTIFDEDNMFLAVNISISGLVFLGFLASFTTCVYYNCGFKSFKKAISSPDLENNNPSLRKLDAQRNIRIAIKAFKKQVKKYISTGEMDTLDDVFALNIIDKYLVKVRESYDGLMNAQETIRENLRKLNEK